MKRFTLLILGVITIVSIIVASRASYKLKSNKNNLEHEIYVRLEYEEKLQKKIMEASSLKSELSNVRDKLGNLKILLDQAKKVSSDLSSELERVRSINEQLDVPVQPDLAVSIEDNR